MNVTVHAYRVLASHMNAMVSTEIFTDTALPPFADDMVRDLVGHNLGIAPDEIYILMVNRGGSYPQAALERFMQERQQRDAAKLAVQEAHSAAKEENTTTGAGDEL